MNSFEQAILDAALANVADGSESEKAHARAAALEAIAVITTRLRGLEKTRALAALLDAYTSPEEEP